MNVTCPRCGMESAYFDGVEYFCPDCDYTWDCDLIFDEDEDDDSNQ